MGLLVFFGVIVFLNTIIKAQLPIPLSDDEKRAITEYLNGKRNYVASNNNAPYGWSASNMNQVFWDDALAATAQTKVSECNKGPLSGIESEFLDQRTNYNTQWELPSSYNIGTKSAYFPADTLYTTTELEKAIDAWTGRGFNETFPYTYSRFGELSNEYSGFEQLMAAKVRYIGCGWQDCPPEKTVNWGFGSEYDDGASYVYCLMFNTVETGDYPWEQGTACSECDGDRAECFDPSGGFGAYLCGGCMSSKWYSTGDTVADLCDPLGITPTPTTASPTTASLTTNQPTTATQSSITTVVSSTNIVTTIYPATNIPTITSMDGPTINAYESTNSSSTEQASGTLKSTSNPITFEATQDAAKPDDELTIILIVVFVIIGVILLFLIIGYLFWRKKQQTDGLDIDKTEPNVELENQQTPVNTLISNTNAFDQTNTTNNVVTTPTGYLPNVNTGGEGNYNGQATDDIQKNNESSDEMYEEYEMNNNVTMGDNYFNTKGGTEGGTKGLL